MAINLLKSIAYFSRVCVAASLLAATARASNLDVVGVTLLRTVTTNLNGSGVRVAQVEVGDNTTTNWQVNPGTVGQPTNRFTYLSSGGTASTYPNPLGAESGHGEAVAAQFYGVFGSYGSISGAATNVAHVDNFEANYFYGSIVSAFPTPPSINDRVVNQSFSFGNVTVAEQTPIDQDYDNYAARYNTLFISAANNVGSVSPPATSYNGIGVGAYLGNSSTGPTIDNGRAKPDITAPADPPYNYTSFSTPQVAGVATVLIQAALRGDGGADTNSSADIRTVKALLLNGAIKPADWTNNAPSPLDARYGAGMVNAFNSYKQLAGGKFSCNFSTNVPGGTAHPPVAVTGAISVLSGWDFNTNTSSAITDGVNHYFFNVTNSLANAAFTATATLVWNRQRNQTGINNLDLYLYNCASSNLVACSTSLVDNVEHIYIPRLSPGRYDLQVFKAGGVTVSTGEPYALAFEFFSLPLTLTKSGTSGMMTWPIYPTGFILESAANLATPVLWNTNSSAPVVTNNQNLVQLGLTNASRFFRLRRPDF